MRNSIVVAFTLVVLAEAAMADAPQYNIIDLGFATPDAGAAQGFGVSPGGIAIGRSIGPTTLGFTWTQSGGMVGLGTLTGRTYFVANDANDYGLAVGTASNTLSGSGALPVLWTNGVAAQLTLPAGQTVGRAEGVNAAGVVVGSISSSIYQRGTMWVNGAPTVIETTTASGCYMITANSINDSGLIVGIGTDPADAARTVGLLYDSINDVMTEIPALVGDNSVTAYSITANGCVVGSSSANSVNPLPYIWDSATGTLTELPLTADAIQGIARGANSSGWVVGIDSNAYAVPFLYDGTQSYRLQDLIDPASGWDLATNTSSGAYGISEDGLIVGTGLHNGGIRAFAMVPVPEPATLTLLAFGTLVTLRRRR